MTPLDTLKGWQVALILFTVWAASRLWRPIPKTLALVPNDDPRTRLPEGFFDEGGGEL